MMEEGRRVSRRVSRLGVVERDGRAASVAGDVERGLCGEGRLKGPWGRSRGNAAEAASRRRGEEWATCVRVVGV